MFGSGCWSSSRRLWQALVAFAAGFTTYDVVAGPGASVAIYQVIVVILLAVILTRVAILGVPGMRDRLIQTAGFAIFVAGTLHDQLVGFALLPWSFVLVPYPLSAARTIQTSLLLRETPSVDELDIAVRYVPMRSVAGDMCDFAVLDRRYMAILVADVTGHGAPATLIASVVKIAFASQRSKVERPGEVLAGMNTALCGQLEKQFVTATSVCFDTDLHLLRYSSDGHPPALLWQPGSGANGHTHRLRGLHGIRPWRDLPDQRGAHRAWG